MITEITSNLLQERSEGEKKLGRVNTIEIDNLLKISSLVLIINVKNINIKIF